MSSHGLLSWRHEGAREGVGPGFDLHRCAAFISIMRVTALLLASLASVSAFAVQPRVRHCVVRPLQAVASEEYSTKVKMTAETRAPLRQARLFFVYPATVAGAGLATYVSFVRVLGGQDTINDAGNLLVNLGVIAGAVFLARKDLQGRDELLEEVAIELGEREPVASQEAAEKQ